MFIPRSGMVVVKSDIGLRFASDLFTNLRMADGRAYHVSRTINTALKSHPVSFALRLIYPSCKREDYICKDKTQSRMGA
jgi:hypothetical protein